MDRRGKGFMKAVIRFTTLMLDFIPLVKWFNKNTLRSTVETIRRASGMIGDRKLYFEADLALGVLLKNAARVSTTARRPGTLS